ncbi:MAG TPA: type II secretion system protein GspK, partial [Verrucomicrobiae bacterium]|nr:type II secretion system protein GspK [Verrucomicrobiae bacterium]
MKLPHSNFHCQTPSERASVLVVVLMITFGLISITLYFANSMALELRASDNRTSGMSADQAIEGAARYLNFILTTFATNGAVPTLDEYQAEAVPVGNSKTSEENAHFWIIGRDPASTSPTEPSFGLIDEGSKFNLNIAGTNTLSFLPNMTIDFANAIADWRDTNGTASLNYAQLGYMPKHASFESVDEVRLVDGATVELLAGSDVNRNGVVDSNENDVNGTSGPGLLGYVTIYTREPNFHSDGTSLTNAMDRTQLQSLLQARLGNSRSGQILTQLFQASGPRGGGGTAIASNLVQFYRFSGMTSAELGQIINDLTFSTAAYTRGRININTASAPVLTALFMGLGIQQSDASGAAQQLIDHREQNSGDLASIGWLVDTLGASSPVVTALERGDYITTRSFQFTAD